MRASHQEQIERWANFVRTNPDWKKTHTSFINALFEKNREILQKLLATPEGKEKVIALYRIKNREGYVWLR